MDVEVQNEEDAASKEHETLRDPESIANVFDVRALTPYASTVRVDLAESEEDDDEHAHDEEGADGGCTRCEAIGACPKCHSLSPWRCGCDDEESEDEA